MSSYATISTIYISNSCITVSGQSTLATKLSTGAAWLGTNAIGVRMENVYLQAMGSSSDEDEADGTPTPRGVGLRIGGGHHMTFFGHAEGPSRIAEFTGNAEDVSLSFTGIRAMASSPIAAGVKGGPSGGYIGLSSLRLHFDGWPMTNKPTVKTTVKQLIECVMGGSTIRNTIVEVGGDDGTLAVSNVINELGTARTISSSGTVTQGRRGGLQTDLYHCRVGDWLVVDGAQAGDSQVPNGALFYDGGKKALSFKDDQGKVHALHGAGGA